MDLERKRKRKDVDWINLPLVRVRGGIVTQNTANILNSRGIINVSMKVMPMQLSS
jgi:hypothetical protein